MSVIANTPPDSDDHITGPRLAATLPTRVALNPPATGTSAGPSAGPSASTSAGPSPAPSAVPPASPSARPSAVFAAGSSAGPSAGSSAGPSTEARQPRLRSNRSGWDGKLRVGPRRSSPTDDADSSASDGDDGDDNDDDDRVIPRRAGDRSGRPDHAMDDGEADDEMDDDDNESDDGDKDEDGPPRSLKVVNGGVLPGAPLPADEEVLDGFESDATDIEAVNMRVRRLDALGLQRFRHGNVRRLCLRQNLIQTLGPMAAGFLPDNVTEGITDLDLYDNLIKRINGLDKCAKLKSLDFSFNKIRKIRGVSHLKNLTDLYFVQNKIQKIEHLDGLTKLRNLELGGNRIREIEHLETLTGLEELWLAKNKIADLQVRATANMTLKAN
jgi:hypothetical protein